MTYIVFGGTGFIGAHFARHLLETQPEARVLLVDLVPLDKFRFSDPLVQALSGPRCSFLKFDIRHPIPADLAGEEQVDLIANFAAIHREPGHETREYFETNLAGAENVCAFAEHVGSRRILFTSSISPYGPSWEERDETSLPVPTTAYGASKLVAETIHIAWQRSAADRRLVILRPGVVFGPGEGGNVTRMVKYLRGGFFPYLGNREVRKAGGYVKELALVSSWLLEGQQRDPQAFCNVRPGVTLCNFGLNPPPSVQDYVEAIRTVGGFRAITPSVPFKLLLAFSHLAMGLGGIHPVRVRKLIRPNLIRPAFLEKLGYAYRWDLRGALADWKNEKPDDWARTRGAS